MAKISAYGATEVYRYSNVNLPNTQFLVRSDGVILRRFKILGKWEGWKRYGKIKTTIEAHRTFLKQSSSYMFE